MKIIKVYPHKYPLHKMQNASVFLASKPYFEGSIHDIKIISSFCENKLDDKKIIYVGEPNNFTTTDSNLSSNINTSIKYENYLKEVVAKIKELSPDLVEVEMDLDLASDISSEIKDIPVILVSHLNIIKSSIIKNFKRFFKIRKIYAFIFVSNYFKSQFLKYYPFLRNKTYVVHNSPQHVPQDLLYDIPKENQIIFLGRATKRKGIKEFLQGVSKFLLSNKNWKAVIVGSLEQQKEIDYLNEVLKDHDINKLLDEGRIILRKNLSNTEAFEELKKSKIALFPTIPKKHQEGIPLVALEAGLAKCLIISSNSGGYPEINPFKETILKKVSSENILAKLKYFCDNEEATKNLATQQHLFVSETFNFTKLIKQFDKTREEIVKNYRKSV